MSYAAVTTVAGVTALGYVRTRVTLQDGTTHRTLFTQTLNGESGCPPIRLRKTGEGSTYTLSDAAAVLAIQNWRDDRFGKTGANKGIISGATLWATKDI